MQARTGAVDPSRHAKLGLGFRSAAAAVVTVSVAALQDLADAAAGKVRRRGALAAQSASGKTLRHMRLTIIKIAVIPIPFKETTWPPLPLLEI